MINPLDVPMVYSVKRESNLAVTVYDSRTSMVSTPTSPAVRTDEHRGMSLWGKFFRSMSRTPINAVSNNKQSAPGILMYPPPVHTPPSDDYPLELKSVDLNIRENTTNHKTDSYHVTKSEKNPKLVIRRGKPFYLNLNFYRSFDETVDDLKLIFEIGSQPSMSDCTRICLDVSDHQSTETWHKWHLEIEKKSEASLFLKIFPSHNAILGSWNLKITSALVKPPGVSQASGSAMAPFLDSQSLVRGIYIIFNAWCADDLVYMPSEVERQEFVLNDMGEIWRGCFMSPCAYAWAYGQFEEDILDACLYMLDRSRLPHVHRANPTQICRVIAEMINSVSDVGLLVGNWTESFEGGTAPTDWTGSTKILRQYFQTGQPVCFGQCWTFAGLLTTILRCFGIPSRLITNYGSAHDSASTVSVNTFVKSNAKVDYERSRDTVWCFHTWNEAWMSRLDLPGDYGGWQAIDTTPQEKTDGFYLTGPASVKAIKQGHIGLGHDTHCFYAEINADHRIYLSSCEDKEDLLHVSNNKIGRLIVTKKIGESNLSSAEYEDITHLYKQTNDSKQKVEVLKSMLPGYVSNSRKSAQEITFELNMKKNYKFGENFSIDVQIYNSAADERTVKFWLRIESTLYHSSAPYKVKVMKMAQKLKPKQNQTVPIVVTLQEYLGKSLPQSIFAATIFAKVEETGQTVCTMENFCLNSSKILLKILNKNTKTTLIAEVTNPLPVPLTRCKFIVDGPGFMDPTDIICRDVSPHGIAQSEVLLTPKKFGSQKTMIVHFACDQLSDVQGIVTVPWKF